MAESVVQGGVSEITSLKTGLEGKVVLVTGASSGLGQAAAVEFAKNKCRLAISGRNKDALSHTAAQCIAAGLEESMIFQIIGDVEKDAECKSVIADVIGKYGQLDVLVNGAGSLVTGGIETLTVEDFDKQMNLNCRSMFVLTKEAVPHLKVTKGSIVNVSSITGIRSFPNVISYCMSKAAVDQFTRCVALELASVPVRCNAVNPGVIVTNVHKRAGMDEEQYEKFLEHSRDTHALGRVGQPEEVAKSIVFLASNELSGFMTGVTLPVDGGRGIMCPR